MMVNDGIRARELRIIGSDGEQLGVKSKSDALQIAEAANLDLVLVSPNANPPVARIMDYGKFRFDQQKREREARKNQKVVRKSLPLLSYLLNKFYFSFFFAASRFAFSAAFFSSFSLTSIAYSSPAVTLSNASTTFLLRVVSS